MMYYQDWKNSGNKKKKVDSYNGRDYLKLELIKGATKAGVEKDQKKEINKKKCRKKVDPNNDSEV